MPPKSPLTHTDRMRYAYARACGFSAAEGRAPSSLRAHDRAVPLRPNGTRNPALRLGSRGLIVTTVNYPYAASVSSHARPRGGSSPSDLVSAPRDRRGLGPAP